MPADVLQNKIELACLMFRLGFGVTFSKPNSKEAQFEGWIAAKNEDEIIRYLTEHPQSNAMLLTDGFCVVDCDMNHSKGQDGISVLRDWEMDNGDLPETWTVITGAGGYHHFYKQRQSDQLRNRQQGRGGMLPDIDIRAIGGLVLCPGSVHPDTGRVYEFECGYSPDDMPIAYVNDTVAKLALWGKDGGSSSQPFEVPDEIPEGQRHNALLSMASSMRSKGYSQGAALAAVKFENTARCKPPFTDGEVEALVVDVFERYPAGTAAAGKKNDGQPKHIALVNAMLDRGFVLVDNAPCIPIDGGFEFGWDAVHRAMLDYDPLCVNNTRKEAVQTLKYRAESEQAANHRFIGFKNGVLDVRSLDLLDYESFASKGLGIVPVVIPHDYDPNAEKCEAVETMLDGISTGNADIRANLEECAGLCLSRYTDDRAKAIWLYGTGQNGKSTYLDALTFVVGKGNTCAVMLDDFKGQFNMQMLVGKLLSIADDQPAGAVDKRIIGELKKIVTGQAVKVEQKGKDPYNTTMFATVIVTSNEPPQLADTTHGSTRRWHMIPLTANFGLAGSGRDVDLSEKLRTEQAAQWLIKLGVDGLRRILANEGMTDTEWSRAAIQEARERSNSVFAFLADHPRREFLDNPNVEIWYWRYVDETKDKGGRPFEQPKFSQFVCAEYDFTTARNGRYKVGDFDISINGKARDHGRKAGDKYRVFVDKSR